MKPPKGVCVRRSVAAAIVGVVVAGVVAQAQAPPSDKPVAASTASAPTPAKPSPPPEEPPVVTHHEIHAGGRTLRYTATVGRMPIKPEQGGDPDASIFYIAYTLDGVADTAKRPLMFSFNGGPGSSSVWLHLGALGQIGRAHV